MIRPVRHLFRPRYDPMPGLTAVNLRLMEELGDRYKAGELSLPGYKAASGTLTKIMHDFILYATIGRDRNKLGPEWAEKAEAQAREILAIPAGLTHSA